MPFIAGNKTDWSTMTITEFEERNKKDGFKKFNLDILKRPGREQQTDIVDKINGWTEAHKGCVIRYITTKVPDGHPKNYICRGGGTLMLLGLTTDATWPSKEKPTFIMLRNQYKSDIKPFSVQLRDIKSLYFGSTVANCAAPPPSLRRSSPRRTSPRKSPPREGSTRRIRA